MTAGGLWQRVVCACAIACGRPEPASESPVTLHQPERTFDGYTLFTSIGGDGTHHLVDMHGRSVHTWHLPPAHYGWLLPNGHLLTGLERTTGWGTAETGAPAGRNVGAVLEVDWDGNVVRQWQHAAMHHDYDVLPSGNLLALTWTPHARPELVRGGIPGTEDEGGLILSEAIREITPGGEVVWEWRAEDHLDPEAFPVCPLDHRRRWLHANSLQYLPADNPIFPGQELILVSLRQPSAVVILDKQTGDLLWRYGGYLDGEWARLGHQHAFEMIGGKSGGPELPGYGNLLVFDNGMHNAALTDRGLPRSRVLEIDPRSQKVVWVYTHEEDFAGSTPPQFKFVSPYLSGAQRLPNGNTLICDGGSGRVFEVTPDGKTVWQLVNPEKRPLFRAYRYGSDFAGFAGRLP